MAKEIVAETVRIFQGDDTKQLDGVTGAPAQPGSWYWEPADYEGDVLWSKPFASREEAEAAAESEPEQAEEA